MDSNPFDGKPFTLSLVNDVVTFTIDGVGFGWGGPIADSDVDSGCRIAFRDPRTDPVQLIDGIAITDEIETKLGEFFTENGLDWAGNKKAIDDVCAQKPKVIEKSNDPAPAAPATPAAIKADPADVPMGAGLVLTQEEHAHTKTLAEKIDGSIHAIGGDIAAAWRALRALLGHYV